MKSNGMWFVREAPLYNLTARGLRSMLHQGARGGGDEQPTAPLWLARLSQTLSATATSVAFESEEMKDWSEVPDLSGDDGSPVFSDGIGYASYKLLQLLYDSMQRQYQPDAPRDLTARLLADGGSGVLPHSSVQIRIGGCKGVVALRMGLEGRQLCTRASMDKFKSHSQEIEVCEWAAWHPGYLYRGLIVLLDHLGVPSETFERLQAHYLDELSQCLRSHLHAERVLRSFGTRDVTDHSGSSSAMQVALALVRARVPLGEPFLASVLGALRRSLVADVIDRGRIRLDQAANLMGTVDEDGILDYGECFVNIEPPWAAERLDGQETLECNVVVVRSPCHLAADVRVLRAVNHPALEAACRKNGQAAPPDRTPAVRRLISPRIPALPLSRSPALPAPPFSTDHLACRACACPTRSRSSLRSLACRDHVPIAWPTLAPG